jgi:hypothetical protein
MSQGSTISSQNIKPSFIRRPRPTNLASLATPLKIQKLTGVEMLERQLKGLCYSCDDKYFPWHKCKEHKLFMAIYEDVFDEDVDVPHAEDPPQTDDHTSLSNPPEVEPLISLNALTGFSSPQTLKLIGYIKHRNVIILVYSGNTHIFIHRRIAQEC